MTTTTGNTTPTSGGPGAHQASPAPRRPGRLTLRRLGRGTDAGPIRGGAAGPRARRRRQPRDQLRSRGAGLQLTSMEAPPDLATSVRRILAATGDPLPSSPRLWLPATRRASRSPGADPPVRRAARHAGWLLAAPGPVPAQGVAMVSQLLADGTGPHYREASSDDLSDIIDNAARALTR